jgi:hypothetical protein
MNRSTRRIVLAMIGAAMLVGLAGYHLGGSSWIGGAEKAEETGPSASELEEIWGVQLIGIRRTALGYMLDFRYRVVDAEKAAPILDRRITPYVEVAETGVRLLVPQAPKLGSMRQTSFAVKPDRDYFIVFANPSQLVRKGDQVNVVVGDFETPLMTVQ